jgi:hypothetical protein
VVNPAGSWHANLQVATSRSKVSFWPLSAKYLSFSGEANSYVIVRYLGQDSGFEAFLVRADKAKEQITKATEEARKRGCKDWAPCWFVPTDPELVEELRDHWQAFGPPSNP